MKKDFITLLSQVWTYFDEGQAAYFVKEDSYFFAETLALLMQE